MKFPQAIKVYGDKTFRGKCPKELAEQRTAIKTIRELWPTTIGKLVVHPRNEGKRDYRQHIREYLDGLTAGASDIIIPGSPSLVIELKRQDHTQSRLSDKELTYLLAAKDAGSHAVIALGWEAAIEAVDDLLCYEEYVEDDDTLM